MTKMAQKILTLLILLVTQGGVTSYSCDNSLITDSASNEKVSAWARYEISSLASGTDYSVTDPDHSSHDHTHSMSGPGDVKAQSYIKNRLRADTTSNLPELSAIRFPLSDITLLENGRGWAMQNNTLQWLHMFDADRLLYNFRVTSNLSTKSSSSYGGWEDSGSLLRGHITGGHFLSAAAQLINTTQVSFLFVLPLHAILFKL